MRGIGIAGVKVTEVEKKAALNLKTGQNDGLFVPHREVMSINWIDREILPVSDSGPGGQLS
jgi:hypothetical protein